MGSRRGYIYICRSSTYCKSLLGEREREREIEREREGDLRSLARSRLRSGGCPRSLDEGLSRLAGWNCGYQGLSM
jgi:hypothetical protein